MVNVSATGSVPCMEGGSGEESYANNSLLQNYNFHAFAKPHLSHALDHLVHHLFPSATVHILASAPYPRDNIVQLNVADFGCSYGSNTLEYAAFIVQGLHNRLQNNVAACKPNGDVKGSATLDVEMQYFFSDLPRNDFNALFRSLEPFLQEQVQLCNMGEQAAPLKMKLFSGGVAGSFHGQLFPSGSLHLAISTYALQWLSQVPSEVLDTASSAWNGGHIWIHGSRPKVPKAP